MAEKVPVKCNQALRDLFDNELKIPKDEWMIYLLGAYLDYIILFQIPNKYDFIDTVHQYHAKLRAWFNPNSEFRTKIRDNISGLESELKLKTKEIILDSGSEFIFFANKSRNTDYKGTIGLVKYEKIMGVKNLSEALVATLAKTSLTAGESLFYKSASLFSLIFCVRIYILEENKLRVIGDPKSAFGIYTYIKRNEYFILYPKEYSENLFSELIVAKPKELRHCGHLYAPVKEADIIGKIKEKKKTCNVCKRKPYREEIKALQRQLDIERTQRKCIKCRQTYQSCSECQSCGVAWCNEKCTKGFRTRKNCKLCNKGLIKVSSEDYKNSEINPRANARVIHENKHNVPSRIFKLDSIYPYLTGGIIEYNLLYSFEFVDYINKEVEFISSVQSKGSLLELYKVMSDYKLKNNQISRYEDIACLDQIVDTLQQHEDRIAQISAINPVINKIRIFSLLFCVNIHILLDEQVIKLGNYNTLIVYLKITGDKAEIVFPKSYCKKLFDGSIKTRFSCLVHCGHAFSLILDNFKTYSAYLIELKNYSCHCNEKLYKFEINNFSLKYLLKNPNNCSVCGEYSEQLIECTRCKAQLCRNECIEKIKDSNGRYQCFACNSRIIYTPIAEVSEVSEVPLVPAEIPDDFSAGKRLCPSACSPSSEDILESCRFCFRLLPDFSSISSMRCKHCSYFLAIQNDLCGFCIVPSPN